jgi:hypothetical protein
MLNVITLNSTRPGWLSAVGEEGVEPQAAMRKIAAAMA